MKVVNEKADDWDDHLEPVLFGYPVNVQSSTKTTPFELLYDVPTALLHGSQVVNISQPPTPKFLAHVYYSYCDFVRTLHNAQSLLVCSTSSFSILRILYIFRKKVNRT